MRRVLGLLLVGLSGFLLVVGLLAQFYVPSQVKKTPLDIDTVTNLTGEGSYLGAASTPVSTWQHTMSVPDSSTSSVVTMVNVTCVMKDPSGSAPESPICLGGSDPNLISISQDRFATNRTTALAVNGSQYIGSEGVSHQGLVNKFPFDVQKKTYALWDGLVNATVDATFAGEDRVDGLRTYKFTVDIQGARVDVAPDTPGTYTDTKTIWIDPVTGSFIKQTEHQVRSLESGDTVLDLTLAFTDATVKQNVDDANSNISQLNLVGTLPLVSYVVGLIALVGGLLLLRGAAPSRRGKDDTDLDRLIDSRAGR